MGSGTQEKSTGWKLGSSADIRLEVIGWMDYLLRYLRRCYRPERAIDLGQAKPLVLGRVRGYHWAKDQLANCQSPNEYKRRMISELDRLRIEFEQLQDYSPESDEQ